jgi:hypothetical protein
MFFSRRNFLRYLLPSIFIAETSINNSSASANEASDIPIKGKTRYVSPLDYKNKIQSSDDTEAINSAIRDAIQKNYCLDLRGGPWRIKKSIDLTEVKSIITDWSGRILVNSDDFQCDNNSGFSVTIGNPELSYKKGRANYTQVLGLLCIISENRNKPLNGLYIKGSLLNFDSIRIIGFNGNGLNLSSVWDSTFSSISCELCGNIDKYQIDINSGGDTSNCLAIERIQSERAFHKCLYINAIRSTFNTIHAERTTILTKNDGSQLSSPLKYTNISITLSNGVINQIIHDTSTQISDLGPHEIIAGNKSSISINLVNTVLNSALMSNCILSTSIASRSKFNAVICESWYFGNTKNITDSSINCSKVDKVISLSKNISLRDSSISSLTIIKNSQNILIDKCNVEALNINESVLGDIIFRSCSFPATMVLGETGKGKSAEVTVSNRLPVTFSDCTFLGIITGETFSQAIFRGGYIERVNLASQFIGQFYNVQINRFNYSGIPTFITNQCVIAKVDSWGPPENLIAPIGIRTERPGIETKNTFISQGVSGKWESEP